MPAFQCLCLSKMRESIFEFFCPSFLERKEGESGGEKPLSRSAEREILLYDLHKERRLGRVFVGTHR